MEGFHPVIFGYNFVVGSLSLLKPFLREGLVTIQRFVEFASDCSLVHDGWKVISSICGTAIHIATFEAVSVVPIGPKGPVTLARLLKIAGNLGCN